MSKPNIYDQEFSERMMKIAKLKFNDNLSLFARAVGVVQPSLARWVKGEADPTRTNLVKIAEASGVSLDWLALGVGNMDGVEPQSKKSEVNLIASNDETFSVIEDCREVRISAGGGGFNDEYKPYQTTKVEKAWLDSRRLKAEDCAMFLVSGDSMYPTLKDGEEIIVDRSKKELKDGKIFVLNNEGAMLVKKVQITYNGITLISQNTEYAPIELNAEQANNLIVIGQVVRGYRDF
ncbi:TPA: XRE family transcriptional regulator [Haemophilus influenzae]|uniref:Helix-turn-helix transcriptional regulator n=1 Tax=Haemophilus haemolyticus TaxID=726 RepID=A0A852PH97_HAEHA|nr:MULTISPECIES: S24 family peptidase [Haemophilus]MBZ5690575.1 helix-turn-helix domain-containing protein [Haemophilus influenzae]MCK8813633.1 helix-turn-helix domain-containing protein [Haemophilus influenzae]MCK8828723.1 helix-turn-helix domain-containing protein [Haemophilus influenzae]MCK8840116.1 helix-turn-helix domain-containing protein [Haemophilus influenzae]MCK8849686.1 helix-turn-helix domain-containing protein [Haemophilus influenzae]